MKGKRSFGIKIVLGLLLLVVFIVLWSDYTTEAPIKVVQEQLEAIKTKQLTEAYYAFTSKDFQEATSLAQFKEFIKPLPALLESELLTLDNMDDQDDYKRVKGVIKEANQDPIILHFQLTKEDEKWKVFSIIANPPH